jgi:hypothetical protein
MADTQEDAMLELAGVPDGTVIETPAGEPNEVVVADYDEDGNVTGWHKEVV